MLYQLYQFIKKREARHLVAQIETADPKFRDSVPYTQASEPKQMILHYILYHLNTNPSLADQTTPTAIPNHALAQKCLHFWADEPASSYARLFLRSLLQEQQLKEQIALYKQLIQKYEQQATFCQTLLEDYSNQDETYRQQKATLDELMQEAERLLGTVRDISASMQTEKRMN